MAEQKPGQIGWIDLTVPDAENIREFYENVIGWRADALSMGEYNDYTMTPPGADAPIAGVCHARGANAGLPATWLPYFIVANAEKSAAEAIARGAHAVKPVCPYLATGQECILRDPAGATFALFQQ